MEQDRDRWNKNVIDGFIDFRIMISQIYQICKNQNVNLSLASQMKCDNMFSDPDLDHIFHIFQ